MGLVLSRQPRPSVEKRKAGSQNRFFLGGVVVVVVYETENEIQRMNCLSVCVFCFQCLPFLDDGQEKKNEKRERGHIFLFYGACICLFYGVCLFSDLCFWTRNEKRKTRNGKRRPVLVSCFFCFFLFFTRVKKQKTRN